MTEDDARSWVKQHFGDQKYRQVERFVGMVIEASRDQNLVAPSSLDTVWSRHVVDSAQLVGLAGLGEGVWLDIGTGGGFPGIVVAILANFNMVLTEPRRKRASFLESCVSDLGMNTRCQVVASKVETVQIPAAIISARAVASIEKLLQNAIHCATTTTRWLLPRGQIRGSEMAAVGRNWRGVFHVEQSITAGNSSILTATGVSLR